MKGLNIKKLAAVGFGAVLMGSALAPLATAQVHDNLNQLTEQDLMSNGQVVNVYVGATAAVSDVVAAANVAAKVAQLSTTETPVTVSGGASGTGSANVTNVSVTLSTLGGNSTVEGGKEYRGYFDSDSTTAETDFKDQNVTSTSLPSLTYYGSKSYRWDDTTFSNTIQEKVNFTADVKFNDTYTVGELVAEVGVGKFAYVLDLGGGIPITESTTSNVDFSDDTNDSVRIPIFGEDYLVNKYTKTSGELELIKQGAEKMYTAGESIVGLIGKDGETYSIEVGGGATRSNDTVVINLVLKDSEGAVVASEFFEAGADAVFYDSEGESILESLVNIKDVYNWGGGTAEPDYRPEILVGSERIILKDGHGYPYDSTKTPSEFDWEADFTINDQNKMTRISISNTSENKWTGKDALKVGDSVDLIGGYATLSFLGLELPEFRVNGVTRTENVDTVTIGDEQLTYRDESYESLHTIPFYLKIAEAVDDETVSNFTIDGKTFFYKVNTTQSEIPITDGMIFNGQKLDVVVDASGGSVVCGGGIPVTLSSTSDSVNICGQTFAITDPTFSAGNFSITPDGNISFYKNVNPKTDASSNNVVIENYFFADENIGFDAPVAFPGASDVTASYVPLVDRSADNGTASVWLLLDSQVFNGLYQDVNFMGTDLNESKVNPVNDMNRGAYIPDDSTLPAAWKGGTTGGEGDTLHYVAWFGIAEDEAAPYTDILAYFDATVGQGNLLSLPNSNLDNYGVSLDYNANGQGNANWSNFGTGNSTEILSGYTDYGTKVSAENGILTVVAPENRARAQILISGEGTSVSSAAETSDGITEGAVWTTSNGMQIKVESVDYTVGACTVEGATCTANPSTVTTVKPVADNLVQVATSGMAPTQAIVIGGQKVNALARNVTVDGQALDSVLVSSGDKVAYIENGMIVAAGFTANDTKDAAALLIDAIERLI